LRGRIEYIILYKKEYAMNAVNYSDLRRNLKTYLDRVYDDNETIIIARKDNENVVMVSIDEYNSLVETAHLLSTEANARHLADSIGQARAGQTTSHDLIEQ
jgi:antitoxin YefM